MDRPSDDDLIRQVLDRTNTTVCVVRGANDPLNKLGDVGNFFQDYPDLQCIEMDAIGHVPVQEDRDGFVDIVQRIAHQWHMAHAE